MYNIHMGVFRGSFMSSTPPQKCLTYCVTLYVCVCMSIKMYALHLVVFSYSLSFYNSKTFICGGWGG